jgi:hypothetical protein
MQRPACEACSSCVLAVLHMHDDLENGILIVFEGLVKLCLASQMHLRINALILPVVPVSASLIDYSEHSFYRLCFTRFDAFTAAKLWIMACGAV